MTFKRSKRQGLANTNPVQKRILYHGSSSGQIHSEQNLPGSGSTTFLDSQGHSGPPYIQPYSPGSSSNSISERIWFGGDKHHGHGVGGYGHGNSPAISALGLLAFLFFLNLIQNSLITNRWVIWNLNRRTTTTAAPPIITIGRSFPEEVVVTVPVSASATTLSPPAAVLWSWNQTVAESGRIGRKRQRRSSENRKKPAFWKKTGQKGFRIYLNASDLPDSKI